MNTGMCKGNNRFPPSSVEIRDLKDGHKLEKDSSSST